VTGWNPDRILGLPCIPDRSHGEPNSIEQLQQIEQAVL
jgi:hypothetical protein